MDKNPNNKKEKYIMNKEMNMKAPSVRKLGSKMYKNTYIKRCVDETVYKGLGYGFDFVRSRCGREFYFKEQNGYANIIRVITNKFLKKYDKNFMKHSSEDPQTVGNADADRYYINQQFVLRLPQNTFICVMTGSKIPPFIYGGYVSINGETIQRYANNSERDMYLYIVGKCKDKISDVIRKCIKKYTGTSSDFGMYTVDSQKADPKDHSETLSIIYNDLVGRDMSTLFFSHNEKKLIDDHISRFNANEDFYKERQLLYKTGILLYGAPGTGKTSLIKAIGYTYKRDLINININNIEYIDINTLTGYINADDKVKYIIVLEDIDTIFNVKRDENTTKHDRAVINKLLQFLDSNSSPNNVIFIATTNHIERLDPALLRDGRFDLKVEVKGITAPEVMKFGRAFSLSDDVIKQIMDVDYKADADGTYNQSKLQNIMLSKITNKSMDKVKNMFANPEDFDPSLKDNLNDQEQTSDETEEAHDTDENGG